MFKGKDKNYFRKFHENSSSSWVKFINYFWKKNVAQNMDTL